jgi:hypothetical protein
MIFFTGKDNTNVAGLQMVIDFYVVVFKWGMIISKVSRLRRSGCWVSYFRALTHTATKMVALRAL